MTSEGKTMLGFSATDIGCAIVRGLTGKHWRLLAGLDAITHRHGGRVYLAKDACCTPERVREGYPCLDAFQSVRTETINAGRGFASALSRQLGL